MKFIDTLMYFIGHFSTIGSLCSFSIRTNLSDFIVFVRNFQAITSRIIFTFKVN